MSYHHSRQATDYLEKTLNPIGQKQSTLATQLNLKSIVVFLLVSDIKKTENVARNPSCLKDTQLFPDKAIWEVFLRSYSSDAQTLLNLWEHVIKITYTAILVEALRVTVNTRKSTAA